MFLADDVLSDQNKNWIPLIKRLASIPVVGASIITVQVVVDEAGKPIFWTEPKRERLEPKKGLAINDRL